MLAFSITISVLLVAAIIVAIIYFNSPKSKGKRGERKVARKLGKNIPDEKYVINDLFIQTENGSTSQIDHILINRAGVWVIETKNYAGVIFGNSLQQYWTQVLAYGNVKNQFYNPVKQNASHAYHISKLLNDCSVVYSYVVFTGNADISNIKADNVCNLKELSLILKRFDQKILSKEEVNSYYKKLNDLKNNKITEKEHIKNIIKTQNDIQSGICPRCGGTLVLRNGKYNLFYGCSNYTKCKFTKNYKN